MASTRNEKFGTKEQKTSYQPWLANFLAQKLTPLPYLCSKGDERGFYGKPT